MRSDEDFNEALTNIYRYKNKSNFLSKKYFCEKNFRKKTINAEIISQFSIVMGKMPKRKKLKSIDEEKESMKINKI